MTTATALAHATRYDIYAPVHKALRNFMMDTLSRAGRLDIADAAEREATFGQIESLLSFCVRHIRHENDHVHAAIDARVADGAARTRDDHVEHLESIGELRAEAAVARAAHAESRPMLALRLYRHLALFVAENFQHMHIEETANNAALWAVYSDDEIEAMHERLIANLPAHELEEVGRWMAYRAGAPAAPAAPAAGETPAQSHDGLARMVARLDGAGAQAVVGAFG